MAILAMSSKSKLTLVFTALTGLALVCSMLSLVAAACSTSGVTWLTPQQSRSTA